MKRIVIKVFEQEVSSKFAETDESKLVLLHHSEFILENVSPRLVQNLMANLARFINEKCPAMK
jgi:hypothetical protein